MFWENILSSATQTGILAVLMSVGFICHKAGIFTRDTAQKCNALLFYIITPCMIFHAFAAMPFERQTIQLMLMTVLCTAIFHCIGALLTHRLFRRNPDGAIYRFAAMYGNIGYMGLPLCEAVLGAEGVFICSIMVAVFNLFCFTHGTALMTEGQGHKNIKGIFINPGTIGIAMGLPIFLSGITLPKIITAPIDALAGVNTPLAMLLFGTYLADANLSEAFKTKENYLCILIKHVLLPTITLLLCKTIGINGTLLTACIILSCVPSANNTVMFAAQYGRNTAKASLITALSVLLSIIVIPIWIVLTT